MRLTIYKSFYYKENTANATKYVFRKKCLITIIRLINNAILN